MLVNNKYFQTIWLNNDNKTVSIIDQRFLPFSFVIETLRSVDDVYKAIRDMHVRGAPLIGATAAFGIYMATLNISASNDQQKYFSQVATKLKAARPTAVNLSFAVDRIINKIDFARSLEDNRRVVLKEVLALVEEEKESCQAIGMAGLSIILEHSMKKGGGEVNILTHCNAGWLACIDYGTATAPIYMAHDEKINVHVWVDETRPRNQGARLTAWELGQQGIRHTVIADNVGGHLMQHDMVDLVIVGCDRATVTGDVANKTGTYLKALAAHDNNIPFYVALPSSSFDFALNDGIRQIPIEERGEEEVRYIEGKCGTELFTVDILPPGCKVANYGFDVTPARLITGLITERGVVKADRNEIMNMFNDKL